MLWELIKTIIYGIVEGVTEWLPISSTGHLILTDELFSVLGDSHQTDSNMTAEFMDMFFVVIQLGAILAVLVLFWKKLWPFRKIKGSYQKNDLICLGLFERDKFFLWLKIAVACIPAAVLGIAFDSAIEEMLVGDLRTFIVAGSLVVYGILFIIIEHFNKRDTILSVEQISYPKAFLIGLIQCLALVPGTSRSGTTILGAMLLDTNRSTATEFSFYLSVPAMIGGSGISILKYFLDKNSFTAEQIIILLLGVAVSFIISVLAIKFLVAYIKKHDFKAFGYYRIAIGGVILALLLSGLI